MVMTQLPPGPKRPLNAFMLFSKDKRAEVKMENPSATAPQITKIIGEMWSGTSAADRVHWMGKANEAKELYLAAIAEYQETHGALPPSGKASTTTETPEQVRSPHCE